MKRTLSIFLILLLIFSNTCYAKEIIDKTTIRTNASCPAGNGKCQVPCNGWGNVYDEDTSDFLFFAYIGQCTNCYTIYACQRDPVVYNDIGKFVSQAANAPINGLMRRVDVNPYDIVIITNKKTQLEGIHFYDH